MASKEAMPPTARSPAVVQVWDPLVRFGHWALVLAFAVAYLSAEEETGPDPLHVWGGYVVGTIVVLRVVWGFVGPRSARFSDFVRSPIEVVRYLRNLLLGARAAGRYLGHSPAGGAMVVALLVFLAATVATGMVAYGEQGRGPLASIGAASAAPADRGGSEPGASRADKRAERTVGEVHGLLATITLVLVVAHILGVVVASLRHRENLVLAMITGKKRQEAGE
jgi:cytochrome b